MTLLHADARIVDATTGRVLHGEVLHGSVDAIATQLGDLPPGVVLARTGVDTRSVLRYLAAFASHRAVALLDQALDPGKLDGLIGRFRPAAVLAADGAPPAGYVAADIAGPAWVRGAAAGVRPHPDLAVLLPTSGSTGNPKLVRLSREAILANARAIATVLDIDGAEVAPTCLPLHYSYGMSVLNSHLLRGATVVVEPSGVLGRGFWNAVAEHRVTSLPGVPYHYEMLRTLKFDPVNYPSLRTLTQAGGKLRADLIAEFHRTMHAVGGRMFVMYGQTEAGPRMSTMPSDQLSEKLGSVGPALPGGALSIRLQNGAETTQAGITGEVIYRGPSVMMGYAEWEAELASGDDAGGMLVTGDLGHLDSEEYLWITGRLKRIGKVFGNRVNLDDLEQLVAAAGLELGAAAAVPAGDRVALFAERAGRDVCKHVAKVLSERLHLHVSGFDVRGIDTLPLLTNGKIDYRALEAQL